MRLLLNLRGWRSRYNVRLHGNPACYKRPGKTVMQRRTVRIEKTHQKSDSQAKARQHAAQRSEKRRTITKWHSVSVNDNQTAHPFPKRGMQGTSLTNAVI